AQRTLDELPEPGDFRVGKIPHAGVRTHTGLRENAIAGRAPDAEDVGQADLEPLFPRQVYSCNTCHRLSLPLLVLGVALADDSQDALAPDHFAMLADWLDARTNLHGRLQKTGLQKSTRMYRGVWDNARDGTDLALSQESGVGSRESGVGSQESG